MPRRPKRPGLAKTRQQPILGQRHITLLQSADYRVREMFEDADVMSEGATRTDASGLMYYGTTSVLLPLVSSGGHIPDDSAEEIAHLLRSDPHARVRAIRIARREAQVRTRSPIGRVRAEVLIHRQADGVRFDVDVEAPVVEHAMGKAARKK